MSFGQFLQCYAEQLVQLLTLFHVGTKRNDTCLE